MEAAKLRIRTIRMEIARLRVRPSDVLVVRVKEDFPIDSLHAMVAALKSALPNGVQAIILSGDVSLSVTSEQL